MDLFFPKFCLGCKKERTYLCDDCRALLDILNSIIAYVTDQSRLPPESKTGKCSRCQDKKLSGLYFALPYKEKA